MSEWEYFTQKSGTQGKVGICVSLSHGEGNVAHPLWSLMKIDFLLSFPKTGRVVFEGCSQEQTLSILYICLLQLMTVGCTSAVLKWGIPKPQLAVNKPSFRIVICWIWNFLTLVCLSCQSWISLLSRSILQSWYLFWAHHCVVCMWCCLEQEPFLYCLSPRTCRSGMNLFRELMFFSLGETNLWSEVSLSGVTNSHVQTSSTKAMLLEACSEGFIRAVLLFWLCLAILPRMQRLRSVNHFVSAGLSFCTGLFLKRKVISSTQSIRNRTFRIFFFFKTKIFRWKCPFFFEKLLYNLWNKPI